MKKQLIALSLIAASSIAFAEDESNKQADAKGLFADDSLSVLNRNYYMNFDNRFADADQSYSEEWGHGVHGEYTSGYTQGAVGFGFDAHVYSAVKLDTGRGRSGAGLLKIDDEGDAEDTWSKGGGALKMRISASELKYGDLRPQAPVYSTGDDYLLPETSTGFHLASNEIEGLAIEAGHFTASSQFVSSAHDDELLLNYGEGEVGKSIDYLGGAYTFNDNVSASFYGSIFDETWNQYYTNLTATVPISEDQNINIDFNMYRTADTGDSLQGEISNTTFSIAATYTIGAHAITLSHQAVNGDTPFDYVGYDSIWLSNSMQYSDFNAPEEESFRIAYELDMQAFGVPGLTLSTGYATGDDADGTQADINGGYTGYDDGGKHWERNIEVGYVLQSGVAKDLSISLRQATHRVNSSYNDDDVDEVRFSIEYPWDVL